MKKTYGKGKVIFHSTLCVILIVLLAVALIGSLTASRWVKGKAVLDAASSIPFDEMTVTNAQGTRESFARWVLDSYMQDSGISEEQMKTILHDGDFSKSFRSDVWIYLNYVRSGMQSELPDFDAQKFIHAIDRNADVISDVTGSALNASQTSVIRERISPDADALNAGLKRAFTENPGKLLFRWVPSMVMWIALSVLLLLLLIRLIVIQVRGSRHIGSAFKTFSVTAFIPCVLLLIASAAGPLCIGFTEDRWMKAPLTALRTDLLIVTAIGTLGCIVLFGFGGIWNAIAKTVQEKHAAKQAVPADPVPEAVPAYAGSIPETVPVEENASAAEEAPVEPAPAPEASAPAAETPVQVPAPGQRKFCRFCGETLVNPDALFCYKCGNRQAESDDAVIVPVEDPETDSPAE